MNSNEALIQEENELKLTDKDIFLKIWTSPRLVFRFLHHSRYDKYVYILLFLGGITSAIERASTSSLGDDMSLIAVLALCIILGGFLGLITYYIYAALMSWTGKWLNGQGHTKSILRMMSYAMIPYVVSLVLVIPIIALFGNELFQSELYIYEVGSIEMIVFFIALFFKLILTIWSLVIFVIGTSEVQKLSIGKSILNIILPALIIVIPIAIIALMAFILFDLLM